MNNEYVKQIIIQAIRERKPIKFNYNKPDDMARGERLEDPYAIYLNDTTGNVLVDIYQTAGDSSDRMKLPGWRPFKINYINNVEIFGSNQFVFRSDYKPNSPRYKHSIEKI